jgi:putative zinc finger/helix-turn-helix YgiT family protein
MERSTSMADARDTEDLQVCSICGERAVSMSGDPVAVVVRGRKYAVEGLEYEHCGACGENLFDAAQIDTLDERALSMACADLERLTATEIVSLRHDMGLTQMDLERVLGASPGSVGRWERGEILQGGTADRLMRLLWAHPELVAEVAEPVARESRGPYRKRG